MIFLDSKKRDKVYDLTSLIPNMMKKEEVSFDFAVDYFMKGLECERFRVFPSGTSMAEVAAWIAEDERKTKNIL